MSEYYIWMLGQIDNPEWFRVTQYTKLLDCLDSMPFYYILDMDKNRMADGIELRNRCPVYDEDRSPDECSVLEMMVALAIRAEEYLTDDPEHGSRVSWWFFHMVNNLGLRDMTDTTYDKSYVLHTLDKFVHSEYDADGYGGLFYIPDYDGDLTTVEIWYQMNYWYMSLRR